MIISYAMFLSYKVKIKCMARKSSMLFVSFSYIFLIFSLSTAFYRQESHCFSTSHGRLDSTPFYRFSA